MSPEPVTTPPEAKSVGREMIDGLTELVTALETGTELDDVLTRRTVTLDLSPVAYTPGLVQKTRKVLEVNQVIFAKFLGVPLKTVRAWEQGRYKPTDTACRFMDEIRHAPATSGTGCGSV